MHPRHPSGYATAAGVISTPWLDNFIEQFHTQIKAQQFILGWGGGGGGGAYYVSCTYPAKNSKVKGEV